MVLFCLSQIAPLEERCSFGIFFFNYDARFDQNVIQFCPKTAEGAIKVLALKCTNIFFAEVCIALHFV